MLSLMVFFGDGFWSLLSFHSFRARNYNFLNPINPESVHCSAKSGHPDLFCRRRSFLHGQPPDLIPHRFPHDCLLDLIHHRCGISYMVSPLNCFVATAFMWSTLGTVFFSVISSVLLCVFIWPHILTVHFCLLSQGEDDSAGSCRIII